MMKAFGTGSTTTLGSTPVSADYNETWAAPRGDSYNTSYVSLTGPDKNLSALWKHSFEVGITAMATHTGGSIFLGVADGRVLSLEISSGDILWTTTIEETPFLSGTINDGQLFLPTREGSVYCFNSSNGRKRCQYNVDKSIQSPLTVSKSEIVFGTTDGSVVVLDSEDGHTRWSKSLSVSISTTPVVVKDTIFVRNNKGTVVAFDRVGGTVRWKNRNNTGLPPGSFKGPVVRDNQVYLGATKNEQSGDHILTALDTTTGEPVWQKNIQGTVLQLASAPNRLFSVHGNGVYAVDPYNGQTLWEAKQDERVRLASVRDTLYVVDSETISALSLADGELRHRVTIGNDKTLSGGPVPIPGGVLVSDTEGTLWGISDDGGIGALEIGTGASLFALGAYLVYCISKSTEFDSTNAGESSNN